MAKHLQPNTEAGQKNGSKLEYNVFNTYRSGAAYT